MPSDSKTTTPPPADAGPEPDAGLWDRLGDRKATYLSAGVAAIVFIGIIATVAMVTDDITFPESDARPAGQATSVTAPLAPAIPPETTGSPSAPATPPMPPTALPPSHLPTNTATSPAAEEHRKRDDEGDDDGRHDEEY
ncbi:hypothetical protein [Streptomyces sp. NPDC001604]|uniref:hypothetical protein n=1 Tax=Streptomyces sp. NPDC001604 TaxID=3364593 RepID=UPI0036A2A543